MKEKPKLYVFALIVILFALRSYLLLGQQVASFSSLSAMEQKLVDVEKERFTAQINQDIPALENLLSPDLVYCHSNGMLDTKETFINSIKSGKLKYLQMNLEEIKVRVYNHKTAILTGLCNVKILSNGQEVNTRFRYTDVYVKRKGKWQLVTWQSLRVN